MNQKQDLRGTAFLKWVGSLLVAFGMINFVTQLISVGSLNMAVVGTVPIFGAGIILGIVGSSPDSSGLYPDLYKDIVSSVRINP